MTQTHARDPAPLDEFETKILLELCRVGKAYSSVALTADLYETTEDVEESHTLEWTLVEQLLEDLNAKGFVTYRLARTPLGEVFVRVRPTRAAYERMHAKFDWITMVGTTHHGPSQERPVHPGDTTDFRMYEARASGGTILKEDFIDHCVLHCDQWHLARHRTQLRELYGSDEL